MIYKLYELSQKVLPFQYWEVKKNVVFEKNFITNSFTKLVF